LYSIITKALVLHQLNKKMQIDNRDNFLRQQFLIHLSYMGLEKLADADLESFIPLSRHATRGGKAVPIPELKSY
jgi:hypothetical protein